MAVIVTGGELNWLELAVYLISKNHIVERVLWLKLQRKWAHDSKPGINAHRFPISLARQWRHTAVRAARLSLRLPELSHYLRENPLGSEGEPGCLRDVLCARAKVHSPPQRGGPDISFCCIYSSRHRFRPSSVADQIGPSASGKSIKGGDGHTTCTSLSTKA